MKQNIIPALRLTFVMILLCAVVYVLILSGIAKLMPGKGKGAKITDTAGKTYYANIGQRFDSAVYFSARPSAVGYNGGGSGGSNKGPNNPDYLKEVAARVADFKAKNPGSPVPVDMVTASGSGLDPDISVAAANAQVKRIAAARQLPEQTVQELVKRQVYKPLLGPETLNVLELNIALDKMNKK